VVQEILSEVGGPGVFVGARTGATGVSSNVEATTAGLGALTMSSAFTAYTRNRYVMPCSKSESETLRWMAIVDQNNSHGLCTGIHPPVVG